MNRAKLVGGGTFGVPVPLAAQFGIGGRPRVQGDGGRVFWESFNGDATTGDIHSMLVGSFGYAPEGRVPGLSVDGGEDAPGWVSPDGCVLYMHSRRNGGVSQLYVARRAKVK